MIAQDSPASEEGTGTFGPESSDQDNFNQNNYENLFEREMNWQMVSPKNLQVKCHMFQVFLEKVLLAVSKVCGMEILVKNQYWGTN